MPRRSPRLIALKKSKQMVKARPNGYLPRRSQRIIIQKKKILNTYIRKNPTVLDRIPLCVISNEIFPFLNYNSRINLNLCLPSWDRIRTKMNPDSVKKHQTNRCVKMVSGILHSLEDRDHYSDKLIYRRDKRIKRMICMLNLFLNSEYFFLYTHFPKFRVVFSAKIDEMRELAYDNEDKYSKVWLDELISTCDTLRNKVLESEKDLLNNYDFYSIPNLSFN